jgi:FtsP/CotA-like multicopper oxidase with cupredoxin domain
LHWHGFRNAIPFYDGVPESSISVPIGRAFTYVYRPQDAGTYMYHCHFEDVEHVTMGMHGIVFVKPDVNDRVNLGPVGSATPSSTLGRQKAYGTKDGDAAGESVYDREFAIMLSEIDARAHFNDAHIQATDWTDFHADFWTFNGRAYPDTLLPNSVRDANGDLHAQKQNGWETVNGQQKPKLETILDDAGEGRLASNPLSSLVQCAPGDRVLIRFANLGFLNHSIVFPGLEVDVLGRDARFVPDSAQRTNTDTIQIGPGESRDVFIDIPALPALVDEVMYPFYDRGMSHYTGSADGSNAWVGGQRSAIQVRRNLAAQEKPNGWGGEVVWHGEQPLVATHVVTITATLRRQSTGNRRDRGTFLSGSVTIDAHPAATLTDLWYINSSTMPAADPTVGNWRSITVDANNAFTDVRVSQQSSGGTYWLLAKDSAGVFSLVTQAV